MKQVVLIVCGLVFSVALRGQAPGPITGPGNVCMGATIGLSDATAGGTWTSLNAAIATVNNTTGVVTGVGAGNVNIKYSTSGGSVSTAITVKQLLPIVPGGTPAVCAGEFVTLNNISAGGGTWSISNTAVATIAGAGASVNLYGRAGGTVILAYNTASGCVTTRTVTVNAAAAVTGPASVCVGQTIQLSNSINGGTWSSTIPGLATAGVSNGVVTGVSAGNTVIKYSLPTGCVNTLPVTVKVLAPITPATVTNVCQGLATTFTNSTAGGGTWSISNTYAAISGAGVSVSVTGVTPGNTVVSFTTSGGCVTIKPLAVNISGPIQGPEWVCMGSDMQFIDYVPYGVWSSSNTGVAFFGDETRGILTPVAPGNTVLKYTLATGCVNSMAVPVKQLLPITPGDGFQQLCQGQPVTYSNATPGGGTWSINNTYSATINNTYGASTTVYPYHGGSNTLYFTTLTGCMAGVNFFVAPTAPIKGPDFLCVGQQQQYIDSLYGGTWTSSNPAIADIDERAGIITAFATGNITLQYVFPNSGCILTRAVQVKPLSRIQPDVQFIPVCVGQSVTFTNNTPGGGTWSLNNNYSATLSPVSGPSTNVYGVQQGSNFLMFNSNNGCSMSTYIYTTPSSPVTGPTTVCAGQPVAFSDSMAGGTWSSTNTAIGTIDVNTGIFTGVSGGNTIVQYAIPNSCVVSKATEVKQLPQSTPGNTGICTGKTVVYINSASGGGVWTSSATSVATVRTTSGSAATIYGAGPGRAAISFTANSGCTTTNTVSVSVCATPPPAATVVRIFPNPNKGTFTVNGPLGTTDDTQVALEITDITGQIIYRNVVTAPGGEINEQLQPGSTLPHGMYLLRMTWAGGHEVFYFVIQ